MKSTPLFTSKCTAKSLWQEYRIYEDQLEFATLFGHINIPFDQIEKINLSESEIKGLLKGDLHLTDFRPALKLDWANFLEHLVVDTSSGKIKRILFTPEHPEMFKSELEKAMKIYYERQPK